MILGGAADREFGFALMACLISCFFPLSLFLFFF